MVSCLIHCFLLRGCLFAATRQRRRDHSKLFAVTGRFDLMLDVMFMFMFMLMLMLTNLKFEYQTGGIHKLPMKIARTKNHPRVTKAYSAELYENMEFFSDHTRQPNFYVVASPMQRHRGRCSTHQRRPDRRQRARRSRPAQQLGGWPRGHCSWIQGGPG